MSVGLVCVCRRCVEQRGRCAEREREGDFHLTGTSPPPKAHTHIAGCCMHSTSIEQHVPNGYRDMGTERRVDIKITLRKCKNYNFKA